MPTTPVRHDCHQQAIGFLRAHSLHSATARQPTCSISSKQQRHHQHVLRCSLIHGRIGVRRPSTCQVASELTSTRVCYANDSNGAVRNTAVHSQTNNSSSNSTQDGHTATPTRKSRNNKRSSKKSSMGEGSGHGAPAGAQQRRSRRAVRAASGAHNLQGSTGLPLKLCEHVLAAQQKYTEVPRDLDTLSDRIQQLTRLLGADTAAAAIKSSPFILGRRPEVVALHLQEWLSFFSEPSSSSSTGELQLHVPAELRARLLGQPNLLAHDVEKLVGNLYEMGAMLQAEDLHAFAGKALKLALMQPATLQQKLRSLLSFLNSPQQQQQEPDPTRPRQSVSLAPGPFTIKQLQQAALRDHRWLMLSSDTLQQRLTQLQENLQIPRETVGNLFLRAPSVVIKKPAVLQSRIAAIKRMPGLGPSRGIAAVLAFPALLNVRQEVLQERWEQLSQAAAVCRSWQQQLDRAAPSSIAALLVCSEKRYDRLKQLMQASLHEGTSLQSIMRLSDTRYVEVFGAQLKTGGSE